MARRLLLQNARLLDPETALDAPGCLLIHNGLIEDIADSLRPEAFGPDIDIVDCEGYCLAPGLIDVHVVTGEPGNEHKETLKSAGKAAASGGVTTILVSPDTDPVIDSRALVDFILRRARDEALVRVYPVGALSVGLQGERMAEIGLMREAGAILFSNGSQPIGNGQILRRIMAYARGFGAPVMLRCEEASLGKGAIHAGALASRLGLPGIAAEAETIGLFRDLALAEMTKVRLLVDQLSAEASITQIQNAKSKGLDVMASVSAFHLWLNEVDIGDYRTFMKLRPPLRSEADRQGLLDALEAGDIDIVTSAHDPRPSEEKRLPFEEASFGGVGLETLLPALLTLVAEGRISMLRAIASVTSAPAKLLSLPQGRLKRGAPADLVLFDPHAPWKLNIQNLASKSQNSPFDGRLFQGRVLRTWVGGNVVFAAP